MSRVDLVIPQWSLPMPWVLQIHQALQEDGHTVSVVPEPSKDQDIVIFGWCNKETVGQISELPTNKPKIVYFRRYELGLDSWKKLSPNNAAHFIFVNSYIRQQVLDWFATTYRKPIASSLIYNGVKMDKWDYKERQHGKNVAMVGYVNARKNFPMALQIMAQLGEGYVLHIAGAIQDYDVWAYINHMAKYLKIRVIYHGEIPNHYLDQWLEDKNYLLCTSISEGNPNNVIEAMAKGIKPVVHSWPGSVEQFYWSTFEKSEDAVKMIRYGKYESPLYREEVAIKYNGGLNYAKLVKLVKEMLNEN